MYWSVKSLPDPQKVSFLQKKGHGNSVCTLVECFFFFFGFSKLILVSNEIPVTVIESTSNLLSYFTSEKYKKKKCLRFI